MTSSFNSTRAKLAEKQLNGAIKEKQTITVTTTPSVMWFILSLHKGLAAFVLGTANERDGVKATCCANQYVQQVIIILVPCYDHVLNLTH